jgi:hypothetical protein
VTVGLVPPPAEQVRASCPNCSAELAPDQSYCLACGKPVSPVRLAFLDVLQSDAQPYPSGPGPVGPFPPGYPPLIESSAEMHGWMRRYSGLLGVLSVLLMSIIIGLLIGHWVTQSNAPGQLVMKVEGLPASTPPAAAANTTAASTTPQPTPSAAASKANAKSEVKEATEATAIEKVPPAKPVKVSPTRLQKLGNTTGKRHVEEVNKLGAQPIETGGGK